MIYYVLFEDHIFIFKDFFLENSRVVCYQEYVIMATLWNIFIFIDFFKNLCFQRKLLLFHSNSHFRKLFEVIDVLISATATEAHAADIDTAAETDEINTRIPTKPGPIEVRILSCRSIDVGIDINLLLMISGSSCCFDK